jgi:DNA-3-methyladenine glycosylase
MDCMICCSSKAPSSKRLHSEFFNRPVTTVAKEIVGTHIYRYGIGGMVTEAEAYDRTDPASYSFRGIKMKNRAMFGKPGTVFVYDLRGWRTLNIVCAEAGSAVLIRAICPDKGIDKILTNRLRFTKAKLTDEFAYCSRPGTLGAGLAIEIDHSYYPSVDGPEYVLYAGTQRLPIVCDVRVNVPKNPSPRWRWAIHHCSAVGEKLISPTSDGFTSSEPF